jgi:uncharacterized protein
MADADRIDPFAYLRSRREELARTYGITAIRVFGSRSRGDSGPDSDIDLLIEAERPYRFDLLGLIALEQELSEEIGLPVDLILEEDLKPGIAAVARADAISV